jgi:hypothetical protein
MDVYSSILAGYAELACFSNFAFLRGASHSEELILQAEQLGDERFRSGASHPRQILGLDDTGRAQRTGA